MSRSRFQPKPKMPGDGCFLCDAPARLRAHRRRTSRVLQRDANPEHQVDTRTLQWQLDLTTIEDDLQCDSDYEAELRSRPPLVLT